MDIHGSNYKILIGDVLDRLADLPDESVHCVATSPPFWGLRDYGTGEWDGGDENCDHVTGEIRTGLGMAVLGEKYRGGGKKASEPKPMTAKVQCPKCGARRVDKQLGLESVHDCQGWATGTRCGECYICRMTAVLREVRRVLRSDGVCFCEIGDSYFGSGGAGSQHKEGGIAASGVSAPSTYAESEHKPVRSVPGLKPKDLCGIPWRLALSLQADGWWLRQDLIWNRPNPMPESVTDRCTKSHSYVFLLTKSARYFYDADAIKETADSGGNVGLGFYGNRAKAMGLLPSGNEAKDPSDGVRPNRRNKRSVWNIPTQSYKDAHFATFPEALVAPMILAGTSERGCCPECGSPWGRVVEKTTKHHENWYGDKHDGAGRNDRGKAGNGYTEVLSSKTTGWKPACECDAGDPVPCTVLDPFAGSCTTLKVAKELGRDSIGIELSPDYAVMGQKRVNHREGTKQPEPLDGQRTLFDSQNGASHVFIA